MAARKAPVLIADAGLATMIFADGPHSVAITFDTHALAPDALTEGASIATAGGMSLLGLPAADSDAVNATVKNWPVVVSIEPDDAGALSAWYGSLPLYLFVILGPALVGAWLAALFVRRVRAPGPRFGRRSGAALHQSGRCAAADPPGAGRARRRGGPALQGRIHRPYEPRTAHAAERDHRLLRDHRARHVRRRRQPEICRICPRHRERRARPARQDRRHPRIRQSGSRALSARVSPISIWRILAACLRRGSRRPRVLAAHPPGRDTLGTCPCARRSARREAHPHQPDRQCTGLHAGRRPRACRDCNGGRRRHRERARQRAGLSAARGGRRRQCLPPLRPRTRAHRHGTRSGHRDGAGADGWAVRSGWPPHPTRAHGRNFGYRAPRDTTRILRAR